MPTLLVRDGPRRGAVIEVHGEQFAVGQRHGGDVPAISGTTQASEAILSHGRDGWYLQRASGAASTWLNDRLIERARLRHLDEIRIGDCCLVFLEDEADAEPVLLHRFRPAGRRTHIWRLGDEAERDGLVRGHAASVHLPLSVILDASSLADPADAVACVLSRAVAVVRHRWETSRVQ